MSTGFRPSPAQPNPPEDFAARIAQKQDSGIYEAMANTLVETSKKRKKPMKYLKKLWKKYMDWLFKDFYK